MKVEDWINQAISQRTDEILEEYGTDDDLQEEIEDVLDGLEGLVQTRLSELIDRMERSRFRDNINIYRGGFRDGIRYIDDIIRKSANKPGSKE